MQTFARRPEALAAQAVDHKPSILGREVETGGGHVPAIDIPELFAAIHSDHRVGKGPSAPGHRRKQRLGAYHRVPFGIFCGVLRVDGAMRGDAGEIDLADCTHHDKTLKDRGVPRIDRCGSGNSI